MAEAILAGLLNHGHPASHLRYSEPSSERLEYMQSKYPAITQIFQDNAQAIEGADVVILAVKPQVMANVVKNLPVTSDQLVISIAGGIATPDILRWQPQITALVRCMPNTPALIGEGAVGLFPAAQVNDHQRARAESILRAISKQVVWVTKEPLMDTVTAVSGSGPAYFFLVMEAIRKC